MDLTSVKNIKTLLENKKPSKHLGQNFLINKKVIDEIIKVGEISSTDVVLEVGPGIGALTKKLAKISDTVISVEKDYEMVEILKKNVKEFSNIKIFTEDILNFSLRKNLPKKYKVVSNLPFYISTAIIRRLLSKENPPEITSFIVQNTVAERIKSSEEKKSFLSVLISFYCDVEIFSKVPKNSFWPKPRVDGRIIKLIPHYKYSSSTDNYDYFFKIVEAGFIHPRKQLKNNLSALRKISKGEIVKILKENKINPENRAEDLKIEDWIRLSRII